MSLETTLTAKARRDLTLLKLAKPLSRFAFSLQSDPNEAYFLVHRALHAAFKSDPDGEVVSEAVLRRHIERDYFAGHA